MVFASTLKVWLCFLVIFHESVTTRDVPTKIQTVYASELAKDTPVFRRECGKGNYHYQTIKVNVKETGTYGFSDINNATIMYGYIYEDYAFDPFNPKKNLHSESQFRFTAYLQVNKAYELVVTTRNPDEQGNFTIVVSGLNNVTLNRIIKSYSSCALDDWCHSFTKGISLTLDDILRNEIRRKTTSSYQSFFVKMSACVTMIMFLVGLINSVLSLLTFQSKELRKVACGVYLLASSITSLLTICMFTVNFWFVLFTQMNIFVNLSVFRIGCRSIEPLLKVLGYLDAWLNACVAIERTMTNVKGINYNKNKNKRVARWIILILPILIMGTIIHEPIHRDLFEYKREVYQSKPYNKSTNETAQWGYVTENHVLCVVSYSRLVEVYYTVVLYFHLIGPFIANLFSALYIIFTTARRRSLIQTNQSYTKHVRKQLKQHKQLLISPIILLVLAAPRLVISIIPGCINVSDNPWLYLCVYFISFTPSMLVFCVFILPSKLYLKALKESLQKSSGNVRR